MQSGSRRRSIIPQQPPALLRDVAAAAGTSIKTASRVINGDTRVAPATAERVEKAVQDLGYRVNLTARSLRVGRDDVLGVIVESLRDPFFAAIVGEVEEATLQQGISVLVAGNRVGGINERDIVESLLQRNVLGLIIVPQAADYSFLERFSTPTVFLDRSPRNLTAHVVKVDDEGATRLAIADFLANGHRRIAFVTGEPTVETLHRRYLGYIRSLTEAGIDVDPELIRSGCQGAEEARRATDELLSLPDPPTAIFSARAECTLGVVICMHARARTDVALISFGDFPTADALFPPVSVIDHSPAVLAQLAVRTLMRLLEGEAVQPAVTLAPLTLLRRGSGELSPVIPMTSAATRKRRARA